MPMHKNSMSKNSKWELCYKYKQQAQDIAQHKSYLKVLYNVYALLLMDLIIRDGQSLHGDTKHGA